MKGKLFRIAIALVGFGSMAASHGAGSESEVRSLVRKALAVDRGAGIQIAVLKEGTLRLSIAEGFADLEQEIPLTPQALMRTGSVSKLFTSVLTARLIGAGRMEIDTDLRPLVPEFRASGRPVTPRQVAAHLSGIRHYDFSNRAEANNTQYFETLSDALSIFADDPLLGPPGTQHHYSSLAFNLLGVAAGRAVGLSYEKALSQWVLVPLSLERTALDHPLRIVPRRSRFYTVMDGTLINTFWRDSSDYYPSGGLLSTAEDLARFTQEVFESAFLDESGRELMKKEVRLNEIGVGYTFGWQVSSRDGKKVYQHGGETNGAYANVLYLPDERLIVTGLTNYNVYPDQSRVAFFKLVRETLPELFEP